MLKMTFIAAATAALLASAGVANATPVDAMPGGYSDVSWKNGHGQWNGGRKGHGGKHGNHKNWKKQQVCEPIIRWKKVGYRYHRRWQPIVVGWDCHRGHKGGHKNWKRH